MGFTKLLYFVFPSFLPKLQQTGGQKLGQWRSVWEGEEGRIAAARMLLKRLTRNAVCVINTTGRG